MHPFLAAKRLFGTGRAAKHLLGTGRAVYRLLGTGRAVKRLLGAGRAALVLLGTGRADAPSQRPKVLKASTVPSSAQGDLFKDTGIATTLPWSTAFLHLKRALTRDFPSACGLLAQIPHAASRIGTLAATRLRSMTSAR
eukprot:356018-Chlamydomonas_euryale.AAC.2